MCGRYYVDDETAREIEKIIRQVDEGLHKKCGRDIHPGDMAPILLARNGRMECVFQRWGFPASFRQEEREKKQLMFNARCETAMEKPAFRESILKRRAVIPAACFYEWNRAKEKNIFSRPDTPVLFMAGCYQRYEDGNHFVILTTAANASMLPVHERMPLILEQGEVEEWLINDSVTETLLCKTPPLLERRADYEQLSLF